jgi:hypothetical protein
MELLKEDLRWCLLKMPKVVFNLMKERGKDVMLAGGFIRSCIANEPINDIDLFTSNTDKAELYAKTVANGNKIIETDNAYTVLGVSKMAIQFINRWTFDKPEDILPSFDFTIAKAAIWFDGEWKSLCDDRYYQDLAAKRLIYCSPKRNEAAGGSILRVLKFYQRGYRIPLDSLASVVSRLMGGIKFEIATDENAWASAITGLLHEVDPAIDPTRSAHLPATHGEEKLKSINI